MYINSFIFQYQLPVDKYANQLHQVPEFELRNFYRQILQFLVFNIPDPLWADHGIEVKLLINAVIREVKLLDEVTGGIKYYKNFGSVVFVDLNQVKCVIGRVMEQGKWVIIDQFANTIAQGHH